MSCKTQITTVCFTKKTATKKQAGISISSQKITLSNLYKQFKHHLIFNNLSYTFEQEKSYAIVGPSGIGKSTLLHMMLGIDSPTSGAITTSSDAQPINIVFQQALLINELSITENIALSDIINHKFTTQSKQKALQLLQTVHLDQAAHTFPIYLSGGQQQNVAVLRALFNQPTFLLADEPTGNLDEQAGKRLIDLLINYKQKNKMGLIISTHDMNIAQRMDIVLQVHNHTITPIKNA